MNFNTNELYELGLTKKSMEYGKKRVLKALFKKEELGVPYLLSPSQAGRCFKIHLYQARGEYPEVSLGDSVKLLRLGDLVHRDKQRVLREEINSLKDEFEEKHIEKYPVKLFIEKEVVNKDRMIYGSCDIAFVINGDKLEIHDDKTVGSYSWKTKVSQARLNKRDDNDPMYELQVWTYAEALAKEFNIKLDNVSCYIDFYNKDDSKTKTRPVKRKFYEVMDEYWNEVHEFIHESRNMELENIKAGDWFTIPKAKWECNYCPHALKCRSPLRTKPFNQVPIEITEEEISKFIKELEDIKNK